MSNDFYNHGSFPTTGSAATSASMRAELDSIAAGFDKMPTLTGNANEIIVVNSSATGLTAIPSLPAGSGGTGITSYAVGDLVYANTTSTLAKLADIATGNVLLSGGVGVAPSYGKVGLTTHVTGTLAVTNGGTGFASYAVGDLVYANTTSTLAKLADIATGNVLLSGGVGVAPSYGKVGLTTHVTGTLAVTNGGTGFASYAVGDLVYANTTSTLAKLADIATGNVLLSGGVGVAPSYGKVGLTTHVTGTLPVANGGTGITSFGTGVATALGINVGTAGAFVVNGGALGTPSSGTLTNATGLPVGTGISGLGTGVATALAVNVGTAGAFVVNGGALGTPSSGTLTNATGLPVGTGISGLGTGVATALAVNVGTAGAFVVNGGALGTPSSGTVTNLTGTASININGTVGATTPAAGTFTALTANTSAVISVNTSSDALRITQIGTGNALLVEDSANPDSTPFVIDASGNVYSGYATAFNYLSIGGGTLNPRISVAGTTGDLGAIGAAVFANATTAPTVVGAKSRNATVGNHTVVQDGDSLLNILAEGSDGTAFIRAASIVAAVDGTPGTNDMPGRLVFSTTADGASSPTEAIRLDSAQRLIVQKSSNGALTALTSSAASIAVNLNLANNFTHTTTENTTLANPTNMTAGQYGVIVITQGATPRTMAFGGYWKFAAGSVPSLTATASAVDVLAYYVESATRITARLIADVK